MAVKQCFCVANLSPNKKSIFGLRTQILSLLFVACLVAGATAADTEVSCSNVRSFFSNRGIPAADIQEQPNSDAGELCLNRGCCAASSKGRLTQLARTQLETSLRTELNKLSETLANRARKFDEFFLKLLQQSREDLHSMFKKTYGVIYEQHSYVFEQLFQQLQRYYTSGDTDLDNMMDTFFGIMYQKMFTVLNSQYTFDDKYLKCVIEHMRETQPFEDVPHKLSVQLRRAFVATRTFHKALRAGADVVRNMLEVGVSEECVSSWARLRFCGACGGAAPPACSRYCHNVLRGCLPAHAHLTLQWDAYVDAVEKVADRLIGPFNIVMVVKPINIKISEAIMYFQEHNQEISQKIFTGCGKPVLGGGGGGGGGSFFAANDRTKRTIRSIPDFDWNQKQNDVDDFEIETSFETLLKEDPSLYSLNSQEDIEITARKLAEQAKERQRFLDYMKGDIDAEEYEEHERRRREAEPEPEAGATEIDYRAFEFDGKRGGKKGKKTAAAKVESGRDSSQWGSPTLDRLVRETRMRVRNSRRYWSSLPYLLCNENSVAVSPAPSKPCFNGSAVGSYTLAAAGEGPAALASNPEVRSGGGGGGADMVAVATQQEALRTLTARLKDAYNGQEVKWRDAEDQQASSSSFEFAETAGSGSGSGDGSDGSDELPDDDEDGDRGHELGPGSGQGPLDSDDEDSHPLPNEPDPDSAPAASEAPFTPVVGGAPGTHNVHLHHPEAPADHDASLTRILAAPPEEGGGVKEQPHTSAAERPSLHRALFTYALPVVCAWFGTIVTDLI